jgi:hypothetical protein
MAMSSFALPASGMQAVTWNIVGTVAFHVANLLLMLA